MVRIFIEGEELDINEGFSQQITYAVDDLQNLDSKSTAFSKTIVIPGTSNNNKLFGNIFEFTNSNFTGNGPNVGYNFNASKSAKVRLEINGLIAIKGILRLLTIIHDGENIEYEVAIFGELGGFINALGNKKLEDLDFSIYNHNYTIANIEDSWVTEITIIVSASFNSVNNYLNLNGRYKFYPGDVITISDSTSNNGTYTILESNIIRTGTITYITAIKLNSNVVNESINAISIYTNTKGRGYFYPLIDYGLVSTIKHDYNYYAFRPAFYVREYLDKIITGAGYTYESNFLDSDFFKRLIVPHNQKEIYNKIKTFYVNSSTSNDVYVYAPISAGNQQYVYNQFTGITLNQFTYVYGGSQTNSYFQYNGLERKSIKVKVKFDYQIYKYARFQKAYAFIYLNGIDNKTELELITDNVLRSETIQGTFTIYPGDRISFSLFLDFVYYGFTNVYFNAFIDENASIEITSGSDNFIPYTLGEALDVNSLLPVNIFQKDFFTSILKMFYLMVTEDKEKDRHLIIEPWVDFYDLYRGNYLDWSDKIDRSQPIKITPMSEINSRYYNLNYKADNDYFNEDYKKKYNEGYGNIVFDNQLEFAKDSSTTEVIFSATPLVGYEDEDKVVSTIFKWDGTTSSTEERVSSNIRILQSKIIEDVESWTIKDLNNSTTLGTYTDYPYAGHLDDPDVPGSDMSFGVPKQLYFELTTGALGNNLFNIFYSSYLAEITDKDSRLVTAKIKLNEQDIFKLDFGKFIWIDGVLYRLNRIIDYTAGEICTIELLRVIYTTYQTTSPAQIECISTENSICLTTEEDNNLTIEN